jgi:pimeloyl-ACP methyl ester carboxylesterase
MQTYILYVPGLGDRYDNFRSWALQWWKLWGVDATLVPITWYDGGSMESKLARIDHALSDAPDGKRIVLVGESAGATLALHVGDRDRRVSRVITLCGVARSFTPVSKHLRNRAPALDQAVNTLADTPQVEVHSIRAAIDGVVGSKYSSTSGAKRYVIWSVGHLFTIALCLTLYAPIITTIAKKPK